VPQGRATAAGRFTLASLVWEALERYADRLALIDEGGTPLSYADLGSAVARRADALRALGARRIAVMAPTESAMTVWWLTAMGMTGVAVTVVSPARAADERAAAVDAFGPDVIVTHADADLDGATPVATLTSPRPSIGEHGSEVLARPSRAPRPPSDVTEPLRHIVVTTSGTTGSPKVVVHSDRSLGRALWVTTMLRRETLGGESSPIPRQLTAGELGNVVFDGGPHDLVYLNGMPVATISGMTVLLQSILTGATSVVAESFSAAKYLDLIEEQGVTNLALSPYMAQGLVRRQCRSPRRTATVLATGIGGGPASADLCREFESVIGGVTAVGYGLTETAGPALMARYSEGEAVRWETVGRPAPGVRARIGKSGDDAGELALHHPGLCHGYLDTSGRVTPLPTNDGFFSTGDSARRRADGNLVIGSRSSDLIIRGGRNVDHLRIERVLDGCPGVVRTAVVGVPSAVPGEEDVVAVVEAEGGDTDLVALRSYARAQLAAGERPQRYLRVERLPTTRDHEVRRAALRSMISEGAISS
jgi:acyl-CoA synthetase (AMP-forming)/AMP-acid ligase II